MKIASNWRTSGRLLVVTKSNAAEHREEMVPSLLVWDGNKAGL